MFFCYPGINQDVTINEDDHKLVQLLMENGVHEGGEHRWNITQPKWHHQGLIRAIPSIHCLILHILIRYATLIVP